MRERILHEGWLHEGWRHHGDKVVIVRHRRHEY